MSTLEDLEFLEDNTLFRLEQALARIREGHGSGAVFFDVSFHYRGLAICRMLLEADREGFARHLAKSGRARLAYLESPAAKDEPDERFLCASKDVAFEDSLAAGDLPAARRIAEASAAACFPDVEYEDDFVFARFLRRFLVLQPGGGVAELEGLLRRLDDLLEGRKSNRRDLMAGLLEKNVPAIAGALAARMEERRARTNDLRKTPGVSKDLLRTEGKISIEGLAVLRLAEVAGIRVPGEFLFVPEIARTPVLDGGLPADAWTRPIS